MVESVCLENRYAKASWVRIPLFPNMLKILILNTLIEKVVITSSSIKHNFFYSMENNFYYSDYGFNQSLV